VAEPQDLAPDWAGRPIETARCLLCAGQTRTRYRLPHLWHQRDDSGPYEVRWCPSCEFGFLEPRPSIADLARFLADSRELERNGPARHSTRVSLSEKVRVRIAWQAGQVPALRAIDRALIEKCAGPRPASICFFGLCENMPGELSGAGHEVVTVTTDLDERAALLSQGVTSLEGLLESPPAAVSSRAFDVVVCRAALERCLDPRLGMEQARRLLKPGGCLMVEIPNHAACSARRLGPAWHHCDAGNFVNFFTARSVARLAEASGFVAVETLYSNYVTQFRNSRMLFEQMLWDRLYSNVDRQALPPPPRKSSWELWRALATSMFRPADEKFEVAGLIARKPAD
jgi:SAM-dependent methyltransferase